MLEWCIRAACPPGAPNPADRSSNRRKVIADAAWGIQRNCGKTADGQRVRRLPGSAAAETGIQQSDTSARRALTPHATLSAQIGFLVATVGTLSAPSRHISVTETN